MLLPCLLLTIIGCLGAYDVFTFHRAARLLDRPAARREAWIHAARGLVYSLQFALVPAVRFQGAWYAAFAALLLIDAAIAIADVACEPEARREVGGLSPGEYLAHIVLSALAGAYLLALVDHTLPWASAPTALVWAPAVPPALHLALALLAAGCLAVTALDVASLVERALPPPAPVHVAVRLRTTLDALWTVTQDHHRHPSWDHRFSRIVMLDDEIRTGTQMRYERTLVGITIRGLGRYKLHRPLRQSTFEFWSDDPRSLIRRGVGLWRYVDHGDGTVELRTSYTYDVRWGHLGRIIDRVLFRPLIQRETERSFARLRRRYFADRGSAVTGRRGRRPVPAGAVA